MRGHDHPKSIVSYERTTLTGRKASFQSQRPSRYAAVSHRESVGEVHPPAVGRKQRCEETPRSQSRAGRYRESVWHAKERHDFTNRRRTHFTQPERLTVLGLGPFLALLSGHLRPPQDLAIEHCGAFQCPQLFPEELRQ